ncbi:MAG TPA: hypothetical protein VHW44_18645 [Pseudonocardiaceae bacterium]|jgi:hypothetical protein|nr:hypothetical protein [Pseudonocardiaceae bacterium]
MTAQTISELAGEVGAGIRIAVTEAPTDVLGTLTVALDRLRPFPAARLLGVNGTDLADVPTEVCELDALVTRRRIERDTLRLHQDVRALAADGALVHRAGLVWTAAATGSAPSARQLAVADIGSVDWGNRLAERLERDDRFASSVSTFDGSIGIVSGEEQVRFRIYRGRIIETARKSLDGATFDLTADERTWVELLLGEYDDYVRFAAKGRFRILGSGFQYLRMTRTVRLMVENCRAMVRENDADQR